MSYPMRMYTLSSRRFLSVFRINYMLRNFMETDSKREVVIMLESDVNEQATGIDNSTMY